MTDKKLFIKIMSDNDREQYLRISTDIIEVFEKEKLEAPECACILEMLLSTLKKNKKIGNIKVGYRRDHKER